MAQISICIGSFSSAEEAFRNRKQWSKNHNVRYCEETSLYELCEIVTDYGWRFISNDENETVIIRRINHEEVVIPRFSHTCELVSKILLTKYCGCKEFAEAMRAKEEDDKIFIYGTSNVNDIFNITKK